MKATGNIYSALPDAADAEQFEPLWQEAGVLVERIVSRGQRSEPEQWYEQAQNEWVIVLKGAARLRWEDGSEISLSEGDYAAIPALCRHRVEWTDPNRDTIWLAVHFPTSELG